MKKHMWIGLLVAGICVYFAFRGTSLSELWSVLEKANPIFILTAISLYSVEFALRSERWAILIRPVHRVKASLLFWPMMIGFFANNVLPLRMGEFVRAHICGTKFKISRTASLGSILLERLGDTLSFLITFVAASLFYPLPHSMEKGAWLMGAVCIFVIVVLVLVRLYQEAFQAILDWSPIPSSWKGTVSRLTSHFIDSTAGITRPRYVAEAMALSLVIWTMEGTFLFLMVHAFGVNLKYAGAFFLLFALGLSVTLPQGPGYVGTFELFGIMALGLLGVPKSQGLPVILAIHGTQFVFISLFGAIGLWREGLSFHNLTSST